MYTVGMTNNNQREIKFRAWDKSIGIMKSVAVLDFREHRLLHDSPVEGSAVYTSLDKCTLMQYTGLKDKNGKEIYEGDIVIATLNERFKDFPASNSSHLWKVEWEPSGKWVLRNKTTRMGMMWSMSEFDMTTIGNVWENPDLLI